MFNKAPKFTTEHLGKTNRIVEGTIITGDITSPLIFAVAFTFKSSATLIFPVNSPSI